MNEPRKTPLINITMPVKQDSLTLFSPQDHWSLRLVVHVLCTLQNIITSPRFYLIGLSILAALGYLGQ